MTKYFLPLIAVLLLSPLLISAQVNFSENTEILLEGYNPDITLLVSAKSSVGEMTVYSTYVEFDLSEGSKVTVISYDKYTLTLSPGVWVGACYSDRYEITMTAAALVNNVKLTPGNVCSVGQPAGGMAGAALVVEAPPVEKPIAEMTAVELQAKISEIQTQIAALKVQLIQILMAKITEIQTQIAALTAQLAQLQTGQ